MAIWDVRCLAEGFYTTYTLAAGATKQAAVDPLDPIADDDATTYIRSGLNSLLKQSFTLRSRPELATLSLVQFRCRYIISGPTGQNPQGAIFARLGGVDGATNQFTINVGVYTTTISTIFRPGGGLWSVQDILDPTLELGVGMVTWDAEPNREWYITSLNLRLTGTATPSQISQAREIPSRRLAVRRRPVVMYQLKDVSPAALDIDPLGELALTHQAVPNATGIGAGDLNWQRRLLRAIGQSPFNLDALKFDTFTAIDLRRITRQFWDTCLAVRPGPTAHGVARWDIGCTRSHTRASKAWFLDSGNVVREIQNDEEALAVGGLYVTRPSSNLLIQSSFRNGTGSTFTGWTQTAGSGTFAEDTSDLLFDPNVVGRSVKLTAGSPHAVESTLAGTATGSISANTKVTFWLDYKATDAAAGSLAWRLQRGFDARWWDGSAWQVAQQTNLITGTSGAKGFGTQTIDVGANATTLTLTLVVPSGGTASRVVHFYHAQIEDVPWGSARIVTDTATVTRAQTRLLISNNSAARFWRRTSGTAFIGVIPRWGSGANVAAYTFTIASCVFDANNGMWVYYDGAASQWVFRRKAAGTTYDATLAAAVSAGVAKMIVFRWAGVDGEQGLTALTQSIFVDGTKGTDVVSVRPTQTASANAAIGGEETTANTADARIHDVSFTEQVLTDQEIAWVSQNGGSW